MTSRRHFLACTLGALAGPAVAAQAGARLTVAVLGATGRTGGKVVDALLAQGHSVRGISRSAARQAPRARVEWASADVREPHTVQAALRGVDAVIYSVGVDFTKTRPQDLYDVYHTGVETTAAASLAAGARRFVLQSSAGRVRSRDLPPEFRASMDSKARGEAALRAARIDYSIVRTPGVWDRPGGEYGILLLQGELPVGGPFMINRTDIAAVLVECAVTSNATNKTFTIINAAAYEPGAWRKALAQLSVDRTIGPVEPPALRPAG